MSGEERKPVGFKAKVGPDRFVALAHWSEGGHRLTQSEGEAVQFWSREVAEFAAINATGDSDLKGVRIIPVY